MTRDPDSQRPTTVQLVEGDNLRFLEQCKSGAFDLIYIDPPFNTGGEQRRTRIKTQRDETGDRKGFGEHRYRTTVLGSLAYDDDFSDYLAFLVPRLEHAHRVLRETGSLFVHLDYREVHYVKVALDVIFGRACFQNEIVWAYDYGARSKRRWSPKHDTLLWYTRHPKRYTFHFDEMDRIPYMAPGLVGPEKAKRGKTPTDTWWHTIVSPTSKEKTGYPTQKPLGVLRRIINVHSSPGDRLLDFFAGSGSFGDAAFRLGRDCVLVDQNPEAIAVMQARLASAKPSVRVLGDAERDRD